MGTTPRRPRAKEKHSGSRHLNIQACLQNKKSCLRLRRERGGRMCCAFSWAFVCQEVKRPLLFFLFIERKAAQRRPRGVKAAAMTKLNRAQTEKYKDRQKKTNKNIFFFLFRAPKTGRVYSSTTPTPDIRAHLHIFPSLSAHSHGADILILTLDGVTNGACSFFRFSPPPPPRPFSHHS